MDRAQEAVEVLRAEGEQFTYENFSSKSDRGYPAAFSPAWIAWQARVQSAVHRLVGPNSAPAEMLKAALEVRLLGNGEDKFLLAKSYFIGVLQAVERVLAEDTFGELNQRDEAIAPGTASNRVFIVHGHDEARTHELEGLLREMGLEPIVLHRQPDEGQTVIEKFEKYSDVGFAFILLTPDEVSFLASQRSLPDEERIYEMRARPNVLFEFGFFVGRLGRRNVCCLYTGNVVLPSDVGGLLYQPFDNRVEEVAWGVAKELRARGYSLSTHSNQ